MKDIYYTGIVTGSGYLKPAGGSVGGVLIGGNEATLTQNDFGEGYIYTKEFGALQVLFVASVTQQCVLVIATPEQLTEITRWLPAAQSSTQARATSASDVIVAGCTVVSAEPTSGPTEQPLFPPVTEADWTRGPGSAAVTILEYTDFQCVPCARLAAVLAQLVEKYPEELRVVFRHYPLMGTAERPIHDKAAFSMQASEAAGLQGKFWEMHDLLFTRQEEWSGFSAEQYQAWLVERAGELGMNEERFTADLTSPANERRAKTAWDEGQAAGIPYAPFVLVDNRIWSQDVPLDYQALSDLIALKLMEAKQYTSCPPLVIDTTKRYYATLQTEKGDIVIELYADKAPLAVNSFVFLAREGWYDGVIFHRVIPDFVAQAGDPSGSGYGGPGYAFDNEVSPDLKFDAPGVVGMVNAGPGSNNSQFFITYAPAPHLDGRFTIFGRVISGMEVLKSLTPRNPAQPGELPEGDLIEKVTIEER